ncbi:MAG: hypothetical protein UY04_C0024G0003 [Parcubacteria group bacterium GW2011_GWA2_47_7]|nr:MAG: hypothetical protein UY04_C0024G0003 [Parcubacteria group bacterium GW2011_GWA2_47_7]
MIKLLLTFMVFAGLVYYFNVDLIALVDKSGAPAWFQKHGYVVRSEALLPAPQSTSTPVQ